MSDLESRGRTWVFDWRLLLFAGVFLPLLLGLGTWQLSRAEEKKELLAQWSDPSETEAWGNLSESAGKAGRPVIAAGEYSRYSWLLDNRTRDGVPGYEVLTLFYPRQGPSVVVNRGWVKAERRRSELPAVGIPAGPVEIRGRIAGYPEPPVLAGAAAGADTGSEGWPRRVQALPREIVAKQAPEVADRILRLENPAQPGAFRADWEPDMMGPQTHYGYALQWFSLAVALIILTIIASYRKQES
ncbi:Cytochrome oxidase assembly protein ShyY1 [Marinobacter daqiaonensis]|uniref:SURF1-like protein n=1 Tax=Marinobacter daqiaonensis TaxID=650891 RepID=A0A1I6IGN8_9GAMM|nr:SURF1 family protein [Marinobacter daqiaonensis]SFR65853.1 Cytochrome oxidase assembly protein ShyY1 [Marinobacter daqiaonensis]